VREDTIACPFRTGTEYFPRKALGELNSWTVELPTRFSDQGLAIVAILQQLADGKVIAARAWRSSVTTR
jgi:hypothetical protein